MTAPPREPTREMLGVYVTHAICDHDLSPCCLGEVWRAMYDAAPAPPAAQPAEPTATDAPCSSCGQTAGFHTLRCRDKNAASELRATHCSNEGLHDSAADLIERQAREISDWKRKYGDANEWGLRNAAAWKYRAERAEAEIESLRAECGLRQIQGYKEGEEAASARLYEAEAEQLTRDMRQRAERAERDLDKLRSDANKSNRILGERCEKLEAERDALRECVETCRGLYQVTHIHAAIDAARAKVTP